MPHADSLEVWQAIAATFATIVLMWALYDSTRDALVVSKVPNLSFIAIGNVLRASARVAKAMLFCYAAIVCLFLPPPPPFDGAARDAISSMRVAIGGATGIILLDALIERYVRQKFLKSLTAQRRRHGDPQPTAIEEGDTQ